MQRDSFQSGFYRKRNPKSKKKVVLFKLFYQHHFFDLCLIAALQFGELHTACQCCIFETTYETATPLTISDTTLSSE